MLHTRQDKGMAIKKLIILILAFTTFFTNISGGIITAQFDHDFGNKDVEIKINEQLSEDQLTAKLNILLKESNEDIFIQGIEFPLSEEESLRKEELELKELLTEEEKEELDEFLNYDEKNSYFYTADENKEYEFTLKYVIRETIREELEIIEENSSKDEESSTTDLDEPKTEVTFTDKFTEHELVFKYKVNDIVIKDDEVEEVEEVGEVEPIEKEEPKEPVEVEENNNEKEPVKEVINRNEDSIANGDVSTIASIRVFTGSETLQMNREGLVELNIGVKPSLYKNMNFVIPFYELDDYGNVKYRYDEFLSFRNTSPGYTDAAGNKFLFELMDLEFKGKTLPYIVVSIPQLNLVEDAEIKSESFTFGLTPNSKQMPVLYNKDTAPNGVKLILQAHLVNKLEDNFEILDGKIIDEDGNDADQKFFDVVIEDTTKPEIEISPQVVELEVTQDASVHLTQAQILDEVAVTVTDNSGEVITPTYTGYSLIDQSEIGSYTLYVHAIDSSGNEQEEELKVNVIDTTKPVISVEEEVFVEVSQDVSQHLSNQDIIDLALISVSDNSGESITATVDSFTIDQTVLGTTIVTVRAEDSSQNKAETTFKVTVRDTTKPEITVTNPIITYEVTQDTSLHVLDADLISDAGIVITDNSGIFTPTYTDLDKVDQAKVGTYRVYIDAKDSSNNQADQKFFDVVIEDTTKPEITLDEDDI